MAILSEDLFDNSSPHNIIQFVLIRVGNNMTKKRYGNELHPLYKRWLSTTQRCTNPNHESYKNYGARGISLAKDLRNFENYKTYLESLPNYDPINGTVDRIDNNKGYEKGNLRWVDHSTQTANQRFSGKGKNKYIGVNWSKSHNRWVARVNFKGKSLFTKICLTQEEALNARNKYINLNNLPHTTQIWSGE